MLIKQRLLPATLPDLNITSSLLTRIFAARDITDAQQLTKELQNMYSYTLLKGIESAVDLLVEALNQQQRVLIIGDFDADGATATALAVQGLKMMGLNQVDYLVPNRFEYGYGLTPEIVSLAIEAFQPQLLITVDNGISSIEGVAIARQAGIKVLITDHHLPSDTLPDADAMVNPNQPNCNFPSKAIAGVGVMFYVLIALRARLRALNYFDKKGEPNLAELLDLVALGTVADVVSLDMNNRILVQQGLIRLQKGKMRWGIKALLAIAGKDFSKVTAMDLGFIIGPRLNAAGRLDDMKLGIECLLCNDEAMAYKMAKQLDELNQDRKLIEHTMQLEALAKLKEINLTQLPYGICLFNQDWHQGVSGILASRLKDKYHRPTIIFAKTEQHGLIKGSARSIYGFHIRDALQHIAAQYPQLINTFGGHAMAAGLTLQKDNLSLFADAFNKEVHKHLCEEDLQQVILTDGCLQGSDLSLEQAILLANAGPWGQSFPEPLFHGNFIIEQQRLVKEKHLKLLLKTEDNQQISAIAFNIDKSIWPNPTINKAIVVYKLVVNDFRGKQNLELMISHLEPVS